MPFDVTSKVNEITTPAGSQSLGPSLRALRRYRRLSQQFVAAAAAIDIATVRQLEAGGGTIRPLIGVLEILQGQFRGQTSLSPGTWIAAARKSGGLTQLHLAKRVGVSRPTIIHIEHDQGSVRILIGMMAALGLVPELIPRSECGVDVQLYHGDCLAILPNLPAGSVDAIITDLPYGSTELDWDRPIPLPPLWDQFRRLLAPNGAVIMTASQPYTSELVASNREWLKYCLVWEKNRPTGFLHAKFMPLKQHEDVCVFSPGVVVGKHRSRRQMTFNPQGLRLLETPKHRTNGLTHGTYIGRKIGAPTVQTQTGYPTSILRFASDSERLHPTQKPLDLMRYLTRTYTHAGDRILDCCMGSGTTGVAAVMEGRNFVGVELQAGYFQTASERIARCREATASRR